MRKAQAKKLAISHAAKVWNIEDFVDAIPEGMVKTFNAAVIMAPDPIFPGWGLGLDPGLRLGLSYIEAEDVAFTLGLYINRAGFSSAQLMSAFHAVPILFPPNLQKQTPVVVEGAAYDAKYGQPLLGQIRGALLLGFVNRGFTSVFEIQPKSIRKKVFGHGDKKPREEWKHLKKETGGDALDAFCMALCAGL